MSRQPDDDDTPTTGHEWDGIREYDNPMPRWWLWTFLGCIVWAIGYVIAYPAWPLITGATPGLLGFSTRAEVAADIARYDTMNAPLDKSLVEAELTAIAADPGLRSYAENGGRAVFQTWCAQCHGAGAAGAKGYPNLLDDDWLWGGTITDIHTTISHGIRTDDDGQTRFSQMPAFGEILDEAQIAEVVQHVRAISGQDHDSALAEAGAAIFADNCAACHADDGSGNRALGAPDLGDAVWLYGGDAETLTETVTNARFGVMPSWAGRLSEAEIRQAASYVHQLGGGEAD